MPTKPEDRKRSRQRSQRIPSFRIENEYNPEAIPQYFQVAVNVLEARKLAWANQQAANSYVVVTLGKKRRRTAIRRNMEEPYYREYFVFEMFASIRDIQMYILNLSVMEPRCCAPPRMLGESNIDLSAIWSQPYHQVFRKWAQLTLPRDPSAGPVGFLKVDISLVFRGEVQYIPPTVNEDKVEDNLLLPSGSEQQRANYVITIHSGFSLPNGNHCSGDQRYGKLPSTFVRVSFCGLVAKTAVQQHTNNPVYNEQISIVEMFPNMSQVIQLEVCSVDSCFSKVLCGTQLRLDQVSHDGENGFLPTFGPSLIHMYGPTCGSSFGTRLEDGPFHRGSLLVSLKTIVPYYQQGVRSINVEPLPTVPLHDTFWSLEEFVIYCPLMEVSMLDRRIAGKVSGVAITMGDIPNKRKIDTDFNGVMNEIKTRKLYYTGSLNVMKTKPTYGHLNFAYAYPVLQIATRLPDFRFRMFRNNMVQGIISDLNAAVKDVEHRLKNFEYQSVSELSDALNKAIDDTAGNILKFLDILQYSNTSSNSSENIMRRFATELDQKQISLQKDEIHKLYQQITKRGKPSTELIHTKNNTNLQHNLKVSRKVVKKNIAETKEILLNLKNIIFKTSEGWPDIVIWLLNAGSRVAFLKISAADIIHSVIPEQCGKNCGQIQTHYMKALKCPKHMNTVSSGCFCIAAKLEVILWMGLFRQQSTFAQVLPEGFELKTRNVDMCIKSQSMILECRCFIYRGKFKGGMDSSGLADPFVKINILNTVKDSQKNIMMIIQDSWAFKFGTSRLWDIQGGDYSVKLKTLTPVWNQILRIQKMVFCSPQRLVVSPQMVVVEVYDSDFGGKSELIGRVQIQPVLDHRQDYQYAPKLQWYEIYRGAEYTGQILMSAQLLQVPETLMKTTVYSPIEESFVSSNVKDFPSDEIEPLPLSLIPKSTTYKVDVYWWGLRDVAITKKPCVVLDIDELSIKSDIIPEKKTNCNFPNGRTSHTFEAPLKQVYSPPLSIRLYDSSTFGRTVFLGTNVLKNPNKYIVNWLPKNEREASLNTASIISSNYSRVNQIMFLKKSEIYAKESGEVTIENLKSKDKNKIMKLFGNKAKTEEEYTLLPVFDKNNKINTKYGIKQKFEREEDWWLRFFCSQKECTGEDKITSADKITIYTSELELQPEFSKFKDWCATLKLYNGKKTGIPEKDDQLYCGFLKCGIAIYRWPPPENMIAVSPSGVDLNKGFFDDHPNNGSTKFLVRAYIVKGFNLMAKDFTGKSDPYVILSCGKTRLGDRRNYISKTLNPLFGKMFEFRTSMPDDYLLTVTVYDYDTIPPDDLIGCTVIDLEDRIYSKHRASCGLASEYTLTGPNKWRDCMRPSGILEILCAKNHIPPPVFPDMATVLVNGVEYKDTDKEHSYSAIERKENICLNILHKWHTLPICGYHVVPEHVETRTLFNPERPGLDQGKLQMWVDIFPLDTGFPIPPPVDITPRKVEEYELRVVVWDVEGVKLDDYDIISGQRSSDIYVKAWIAQIQKAQQTDIHYRSLTGIGNFNWRMVFRFHYQHAERKIILKETSVFTEYEEHIPPFLMVQVMDSDAITADDFLGSLTLNLNSLPRGAKTPRHASSPTFDKVKKVNLFTIQSLRGWWPLKYADVGTKKSEAAGVIDLELTLLPIERALLMPVGIGREAPQPLPPPNRPDTSYNMFMSPLNALKSLCTSRGYKTLAMIICLFLLLMLLFTTYMELPKILLERWLGRRNY